MPGKWIHSTHVPRVRSRRWDQMATKASAECIETNIPARLDRLPWSHWHLLVVVALSIIWLLDGLETNLAGSLADILKAQRHAWLDGRAARAQLDLVPRRCCRWRAGVWVSHRPPGQEEAVQHHDFFISLCNGHDRIRVELLEFYAVPRLNGGRNRRRVCSRELGDR